MTPKDRKWHELKTWPEPFQAVFAGDKTYEIRKNDRDFQVGDVLYLREYDPDTREYTGSNCVVRVTYMTPGGSWGLPEDVCVMAIGFSSGTNLKKGLRK